MHPLCTSSVRASADLLNKSFVWFILTNLTNSPIWPGITSLYNQALPSSSLFKPKCQNASCTLQDVLKRTLRLWVSEHVWTRTLASWMDLLVYEQLSATGRFTRNISRKCNTVLSPKILGVNTGSRLCVHWGSVPAPHSFKLAKCCWSFRNDQQHAGVFLSFKQLIFRKKSLKICIRYVLNLRNLFY